MSRPPIPLPRRSPFSRGGDPLDLFRGESGRKIGDLLGDVGSGLLQGKNWQEGLRIGLGEARQLQPYREAKAEERQTRNKTIQWLERNGRQDLIDRLDAGEPMQSIWAEATRAPAKAEPFTLGPGQARYAGDGSMIAEGPPDNQQAFSREKDLASSYANADPVKVYNNVRDGYERVTASAAQQSGAGDLALVYGYMKMLDPGSVVRESEYAMAAQAGDFGEQVQGAITTLLNGQRLPESQRQEFLRAADALYQQTAANLGDTNNHFSQRAQRWGVDPTTFVRTPEFYPPRQAAPTGPSAPAIDDIKKRYGLM